LVGPRNDIPSIMNGLDLLCSSSFSEAFPNVLCEAMAAGVPCVTTDVGDSGYIVGDTGWVVPPRSPELLSEAIFTALSALPCVDRSRRARARIVENFSINNMANQYESAWLSAQSN
jgi:glycosyltransferase involved in cell wall biosynthesis